MRLSIPPSPAGATRLRHFRESKEQHDLAMKRQQGAGRADKRHQEKECDRRNLGLDRLGRAVIFGRAKGQFRRCDRLIGLELEPASRPSCTATRPRSVGLADRSASLGMPTSRSSSWSINIARRGFGIPDQFEQWQCHQMALSTDGSGSSCGRPRPAPISRCAETALAVTFLTRLEAPPATPGSTRRARPCEYGSSAPLASRRRGHRQSRRSARPG